jgi:hypothetical protein
MILIIKDIATPEIRIFPIVLSILLGEYISLYEEIVVVFVDVDVDDKLVPFSVDVLLYCYS